MNSKVFIISGPPGAGKSSLAKSIAQLFNKSIHIECDCCVIRSKAATDSTAKRPPVPCESGHRFHGKPATLETP